MKTLLSILLSTSNSLPLIHKIIEGWALSGLLVIVIPALIYLIYHYEKKKLLKLAFDTDWLFRQLYNSPELTDDDEIVSFVKKAVSSYSWRVFTLIDSPEFEILSIKISEILRLLKRSKGICSWDNITESAFSLTTEEAESQMLALLREFRVKNLRAHPLP